MSLEFLSTLQSVYDGFQDTNSSQNNAVCTEVIPHQTLYQFLLIPAVVFTLLLAFAEKRVYMCLQCLSGRPGVVYPMDIMGRSSRVSYAAAFGATASLCSSVIFEQKYAVELGGASFVKVFAILLSMLIYGLDFMPLFTAITANSSLGFAVGTLYAWAFTLISFFRNFYCDNLTVSAVFIIIARSLPELLCHLYLSISLPVRFVRSLWRKRHHQDLAVDFEDEDDIFDSIKRSYQGLHVVKLFKPPKAEPQQPNGLKDKIISIFKGIYHKVVYSRLEDFRYSTRMLSVSVVSFILIYQVYVELLVTIIGLVDIFFTFMVFVIDTTDDDLKWVIGLTFYVVNSVYISLIVSLTISFVVGVIMIVHTLASYRTLLLGLYKGDNGHLTPKEEKSNSTLLIGSMRYAGYQVAYVAWGYFIQFLLLFIVAIVLAVIIILVINGFHGWLVTTLHNVWPVLLSSLVVNIIQKLMCTFAFLQQRGKVLAIDNRRVFFIVVYFMFFYNIFLGLVSCLLRIIKAMGLGALFLPRLDHSTLPRKFQWFDPGFDAFCGFMHVENAHTHPVVLTFISLVQAEIIEKKRAAQNISLEGVENGTMMLKPKRPINTVARFKWKLAYTLIKNPQLFIQRKDAMMQIFKQREIEAEVDDKNIHIEILGAKM
ncbi:receptor for retinol uptake stra6-like isoform X1 [Mytilus californianus]|uniref:receptor for retinol uptake stra6-like isoform X1 n=2 Tax=Mytilus californianus TaxID=6549 RepID=UPI002246775F|nr:receptor for retinol uptake stra6-like isoform X1 [Mytilus californianus]XP_052103960.1 receptor for retinol uptake stra6-like isoform X1 [Mytilus californianus]